MRPNPRSLPLFALALLLAAAGCGRGGVPAPGKRVVVLGFDGMDYALTKRLLDAGKLPNLARLAQGGGFQALTTSVPPQSPVAWSEFITGLDAGGHGIFDFVHRDPATLFPYLSTTRTEPPGRMLHLGKWQLPLSGGKVTLLRQGRAAHQRPQPQSPHRQNYATVATRPDKWPIERRLWHRGTRMGLHLSGPGQTGCDQCHAGPSAPYSR